MAQVNGDYPEMYLYGNMRGFGRLQDNDAHADFPGNTGPQPMQSTFKPYLNNQSNMQTMQAARAVKSLQGLNMVRNPMGGTKSSKNPKQVRGYGNINEGQNWQQTNTNPSLLTSMPYDKRPQSLKEAMPDNAYVQGISGRSLYQMAQRIEEIVNPSYSVYMGVPRDSLVNLYKLQQMDFRDQSVYNRF